MQYYLIDYENVNAAGLSGIDEIPAESRVVLFFTKKANKIDLNLVDTLRRVEAELTIIEVHHGKQALDIQLGSYVGYLIGTQPEDTEYIIVSKDKGYRNIQDFWTDRNIHLCPSIRQGFLGEDESEEESGPKTAETENKSASRSRGRSGGRNRSGSRGNNGNRAKADSAGSGDSSADRNEVSSSAESDSAGEGADGSEDRRNLTSGSSADRNKAGDASDSNTASETAETPAKSATSGKRLREFSASFSSPSSGARGGKRRKPAEPKTETKAAPADGGRTDADSRKAEKKDSGHDQASGNGRNRKDSQKAEAASQRNEINTEIQKTLSKAGIEGDIINATASFVSKTIGKDGYKQLIYRGIIKEHGQKKGLEIYRLIKDML